MYDTVLAAQALAIEHVKPGVKCNDLHNTIANYLSSAGYKTGGQGKEFKYQHGFVHSLGHGIGQDIHQSPKISSTSEDVLQPDQVITIEPGLYYPDIGGVRIEDMVLVTDDGCEVLTKFPKQFSN